MPSPPLRDPGASPPDAAFQRSDLLDVARGLAVIGMIATHSIDLLLDGDVAATAGWRAIDILCGLVAPAFLLISGVSLRLAIERAAPGRGSGTRVLRKRIGRALGLLALGVGLQLPILSIRQLVIVARPDHLEQLFAANILQVIAITTLVVLALGALLRRDLGIWVGLLAVLVAVATPYVWSSDLHMVLPVWLRSYVLPQPHSIFPLFPYSAYLFVGVAVGMRLRAIERTRGWTALFGPGVALLVAAGGLHLLLGATSPHSGFWGGSIQGVVLHAGGVAMLLWLCGIALSARRPPGRALAWLGRNALAAYVLHLMILYGSPINPGIAAWLGGAANTFSPAATAAAGAAVTALTAAAILLWRRTHALRPNEAAVLRHAFWTLLLVVLLFKP